MNVLAIAWLALGLVWAVGFGSRAAWVAGEHNRRRQRWFLFGAVLGPGALAILDAAPPGACARCLSPVEGWSTTCVACGEDVRANPMVDLMLGSEQVQPRPAGAPTAAAAGAAVVPDPVPAASPVPAPVTQAATLANEVPPPDAPPTRRRAPAARTVARRARPPDDLRPAAAAQPAGARAASVQPASAQPTPPAPSVADAGAVTKAATAPTSDQRGGGPQLDLDLRRPMRLASCVFVEGTEALVPGMWYQLTTEGAALSISGPPGSLPNASAITWPLTEIKVQTRGDRLVVASVSGSDDDLRLVFKSTLDWTPLGLTREVDARRLGLSSGTGDA